MCVSFYVNVFNHCRDFEFTSYLSNFVYWVGFVTGVTFTTHLWVVYFIDFRLVGKIPSLSLGCYFWEKDMFFELYFSSCFRPNQYTRMCVSTIGSFSFVDKILKTLIVTHKSNILRFLSKHVLCLSWLFFEANILGLCIVFWGFVYKYYY